MNRCLFLGYWIMYLFLSFFSVNGNSQSDYVWWSDEFNRDESLLLMPYYSDKFGNIPWMEIPLFHKEYRPDNFVHSMTRVSLYFDGISQDRMFFESHPAFRHYQNKFEALDPYGGSNDRYQFHVLNYQDKGVFENDCANGTDILCKIFYHLHWGYTEYRTLRQKNQLTAKKIEDLIRRNRFADERRIPSLESAKWLIDGLPAYAASNPGPLFTIGELLNQSVSGLHCRQMGFSNCRELVNYKLRLNLALFKVGLLDPKGRGLGGVEKAKIFRDQTSALVSATKRLQVSLTDVNLKKEVLSLGHILFETPKSLEAWRQVFTSESVLLSGGAQELVNDLLVVIDSFPIIDSGYSYLVAITIEHPLVRILLRLFTEPQRDFIDISSVLFENSKRINEHAEFILLERQKSWGE